MKRRLVLRARAEVDIAEVAAWYERRATRLAIRFLDAVDDAIANLTMQPLSYRVVEGDVRRVLMTGFPYHLYFVVEPEQVVILGVCHAARHPDSWRERL